MPELTEKQASCPINGEDMAIPVGVVPEDDVFEVSSKEDIILLVPGNPGLAAFYLKFAKCLRKELEEKGVKRRMTCLSFAGHAPGKKHGVYGVADQIKFVKKIVEKIIEKNPEAKLHLVGHSVGAHISVHVSSQLPEEKILTVTGLFPTVEHIAKGSNAVNRPVFFPVMRHFAAGLASLVGLLPTPLLKRVSGFFANTKEDDHVELVASMGDYRLVNNILYMAHTEMYDIKDVCHDTLSKVAPKCTFYYGEVDGWVPNHLIPDMRNHLERHTGKVPSSCPKQDLPRVIEDSTGAPHAFVLSHSEEVAKEIAPIFC